MKRQLYCPAVLFIVLLFPKFSFAQDQFFDSNGVSIHYVEQGNGEPIVLLHGIGGSLQSFVTRDIVSDLAQDYRVIAFDLRGHGMSGKPHDPQQYGREMGLDVVRLLDHLNLPQAHIVGYSLGGFITSQLLTLHPERFLTATLVAGAGRFDWTEEQAQLAEQEAVEREQEYVSRMLIYRLAPTDQPPPTDEAIKASSDACFADANQDRFAIAALTRSRADQTITPAEAANVVVPTLGIVGSLDPLMAGLEQLKAIRPSLRYVVVDGAVHSGDLGILARPELLVALREFISAN
jgi:pimeloyl-ACP methyl ester carboxylesterase